MMQKMLLREMALPKAKRGNNLFKSSVLSVGLTLRPGVESSLLLGKLVQNLLDSGFQSVTDCSLATAVSPGN